MDQMEKQMRELSLEMYEIKEKIESAKRADLPDKIRNFAIEELNERYEAKYEEFHQIEMEYNTLQFKENTDRKKVEYEHARNAREYKAKTAEKKQEYDELRAKRAEEAAEFNRKMAVAVAFASENPSASLAFRKGASVEEIYNQFGEEIRVFEKNMNSSKQEPVIEEPVVVSENENVNEDSVVVQEPVMPELKNDEVRVGTEEADENNLSNDEQQKVEGAVIQDPILQEAANMAGAAVVSNELTPEQQEKTENAVVQDPVMQDAMSAANDNTELTPEQQDVMGAAVMQDPELQQAAQQAQTVASNTSATDALNEMTQGTYNYDNNPEPRRKVSAIKQAGNALKNAILNHKKAALVAIGAIGAIVLVAAVPAIGFVGAGVAGVAAVHEFNKGRSGK